MFLTDSPFQTDEYRDEQSRDDSDEARTDWALLDACDIVPALAGTRIA